jgi:hypothetical protein
MPKIAKLHRDRSYKIYPKTVNNPNFEKPFLGRLAQVADCSRISNLLDERHLGH